MQEFNENQARAAIRRLASPARITGDTIPWFSLRPKPPTAARGTGPAETGVQGNIKAFHKAGIEVIWTWCSITRRKEELGPTLCFRGMDKLDLLHVGGRQTELQGLHGNGQHYQRKPSRGAGSYLAALRYWVVEMHVDGFRFDWRRSSAGTAPAMLLANAPLLERIAEDPILET